jgi:hypothetical protein
MKKYDTLLDLPVFHIVETEDMWETRSGGVEEV